jgi:hypothetical protein
MKPIDNNMGELFGKRVDDYQKLNELQKYKEI